MVACRLNLWRLNTTVISMGMEHLSLVKLLARCLSVSWHICIIWIFISQESRRRYIFKRWCRTLAISLKLYELHPSRSSISLVVIHEMGVFINSNTSVGSGGLFTHASLNLLAIVVIFTEHVLTIVFIPVTLFISQETEGLYSILRDNNNFIHFSPNVSSI